MPDKTIAVFGATGLIGSAVVSRLLAHGHQVRALARDPVRLHDRAGVTVVAGDVGDPALVRKVIAGSAAVVSCLGTRRGDRQPATFLANAVASILAAMRTEKVGRLVAISGAGIRVAGESKPFPHNLITRVVRVLAAEAVEAKQREFEVLRQAGDIEWTAVRPTRVVPGVATGRTKVSVEARSIGMRVTVGDLAAFIAGLIEDGGYIREAPFISSRR